MQILTNISRPPAVLPQTNNDNAGHHANNNPPFPHTHRLQDKQWAFWERRTHAVVWRLLQKGLLTLDELRRAVEALPDAEAARSYYEKWAAATTAVLLERGAISRQALDARLGPLPGAVEEPPPRFKAGDVVRVLHENAPVRWRRPHLRTPGYIFGVIGVVERECVGAFKDPERGAFREAGPRAPLFRVRFFQSDLWEGYAGGAPSASDDTVDVEIYQPWLEAAAPSDLEAQRRASAARGATLRGGAGADCTRGAAAAAGAGAEAHSHGHDDHHHHHHGHEHGHHHHHHDHGDGGAPHIHEARADVEAAAVAKEGDDSERSRLPEVLFELLVETVRRLCGCMRW